MKYIARLWWGIVIYAIMYLTWNGFTLYGFTNGIAPRICELVVLVGICTIAGRAIKFNSWKDILPYSIFWALTAVVFDAVFTVPFSGTSMYGSPNIWIGYALVVLLPLASPLSKMIHDDSAPAL
jgi:hypothetical protein